MDATTALFEKIGRQEMLIESLRVVQANLSQLLSQFVSGEEKPEDWKIVNGRLVKQPLVEQPEEKPKAPVKRKE